MRRLFCAALAALACAALARGYVEAPYSLGRVCHESTNVVLLEVEPEKQKTLPDFRVYEGRLGIHTVDIAKLVKQGRRLFYCDQATGRLVRIERIYNRVIVDELEKKQIVKRELNLLLLESITE